MVEKIDSEQRARRTDWGALGQRLVARLPAAGQLDGIRFALLVFGVLCEIAAVWITWPLWQIRSTTPHLPAVDLPQISVGWLMVGSAGLILLRPRWGIVLHGMILGLATLLDQFRLQPQFYSIVILIGACVWDRGRIVARWYLTSTWLWAGLHKLVSSDWFGHSSHWLVERTSLDADTWHVPLAITIALSEVALGVLAIFRPRWAAVICVPMHLGIIAFLIVVQWNWSVIPWNLSMATLGCWVMLGVQSRLPTRGWESVVCIVWLVAPLGFYLGWVDRSLAGVLYSDSLPRGWITTRNGVQSIEGWGDLAVPFPYERRTLRIYFEKTAEPGDKLHIADPRWLLDDQFFVMDVDRQARPIGIDTFLLSQSGIPGQMTNTAPTVAGIGVEEQRVVFALSQAGVRMLQTEPGQPIYAVAFTPENYNAELLRQLKGLPNLTQIQLADTAVQDDDLSKLNKNRLLTGIGFDRTGITDAGLAHLRGLPFLEYIECEGTAVTAHGIESVMKSVKPIPVE